MTREELVLAVERIIDGEHLEIIPYVVITPQSVFSLDIEENTLNELKVGFVSEVRRQIISSDYTIRDYSSADARADSYFKYDLNDVPEIFSTLLDVQTDDNISAFSTRNQAIKDITGLAIVLADGDNALTVFKQIYNVEKITAKERKLFKFTDADRFVAVSEDMINITPGFSVVCINGEFIITEISKAESKLGLTKIMTNEAHRLANDFVQASTLLKDGNILNSHIDSDIKFAKKVVAVLRNSLVLYHGIPRERIVAFAQSKVDKIGNIPIDETTGQFAPKHKTELNRILKILNDDLLKSELTEEEYDSPVKDVYSHQQVQN